MKRFLTILLLMLLALALVACGNDATTTDAPIAGIDDAQDNAPPDDLANTPETPETSVPDEPIDSITLDFADITLERVGVDETVRVDISDSSYTTSSDEDDAQAVYLMFKIKNTSTETISSWDFFVGNVSIGAYTYEIENLSGITDLAPLKSANYAVYAQIPNELFDSGEPFVFNIGCNTMFASDWETTVESCEYQYTYTLTAAADGFEVATNAAQATAAGGTDSGDTTSASTGSLWQLYHYVDEFNQETDEAFIMNSTFLVGTFSNSATTNSNLYAEIMIDKEYAAIMLYEYGRNIVKNSSTRNNEAYDIKMKLADGSTLDITGTMWTGGDRIIIDEAYKSEVIAALSSEAVGDVAFVSFYIVQSDRPTTNYLLSVPMSNFAEAYKAIAE